MQGRNIFAAVELQVTGMEQKGQQVPHGLLCYSGVHLSSDPRCC